MTRKTARTSAFVLAGVLLVIVALKGGAAKYIAVGALTIVGAIAGVDVF